MGIFRPVELRAYDSDRIEDVLVLQHHREGQVELEIQVDTAHHTDCDLYARIDGQQVKLAGGAGITPALA